MRQQHNTSVRKPGGGTDHLEDLSIDGRIILKLILNTV
jgi:hypothetical protein